MAVLFALDRADARDEIAHLTAANDVVILDRYVASNAAYSAARLHQGADGDVVAWVRDLEYDRLELPKPDWQVLLAVPVALAAERAEQRAREEADRAKDAYERDDGLQQRTAEVYCALAAADWCGPWAAVPPDIDATALVAKLAESRPHHLAGRRDCAEIAESAAIAIWLGPRGTQGAVSAGVRDPHAGSTRKTPVW